jgi:hypothetical protein
MYFEILKTAVFSEAALDRLLREYENLNWEFFENTMQDKSVLVYNFRCSAHSSTYKIIQQNLKCMQEILCLFVIVMTMISIMPNIFRHHHFLFLSCSFYDACYWHRLSVLFMTLTDGMKYAVASLRSANL